MTVDVRLRRHPDKPTAGAHFSAGQTGRPPGDPHGGITR
jgi:hypothetical protein